MIKSVFLATALALAAVPAQAVTLVLDSGWQNDSVQSSGVPSDNSPWSFTLTSSAFFRVTDAFTTGDIYSIVDSSNVILASTSFTTDGALVPAYFGVAWNDIAFSRLSLLLAPGSYAFLISGNCASGCPAGFGVRLDSVPVSGVPETATWAMLIAGFGLVGATMRRRKLATTVVSA